MPRRWSISLTFAGLAVGAALGQGLWTFLFLGGATSDVLAYCMSMLGVVVVPLSMAASGAALLPPAARRLRWSIVAGAALTSLTAASEIGGFFLADDVPPGSVLPLVAGWVMLAALVLLAALLVTVVLALCSRLPVIPRVVLALTAGVVGSVALTLVVAEVMPVCVAAVAMFVALLVIRRAEFRAAPDATLPTESRPVTPGT